MVDLGARRRLVGDDGVVDSVATWAWMLFSLWWRAFYFSLGHFKFRRENWDFKFRRLTGNGVLGT